MEISTASEVIPTLKRMRDFLMETRFNLSIQSFAESLASAIDSRVANLAYNSTLQLATLLDPRFAFDEKIWIKSLWSEIEKEIKDFAKTGLLFCYLRNIYQLFK